MADNGDKTQQEPGIKVDDKRRFNAEGTARDDVAEGPESAPIDVNAEQAAEADPAPAFQHRSKREPSTIDFSGFVLSLAQAALVDLGVAPHPDSDEIRKDLPQARNTIDILGIVREKTTGNLSDEEAKLLDGLLYQLRLVFLETK